MKKQDTVQNIHIGSAFEDFLEEEGIKEEVTVIAQKRLIAWRLRQAMKEKHLSQEAMAKKMKTSRPSVHRLLDPENTAVTLKTMQRAADALNKELRVEFVDK